MENILKNIIYSLKNGWKRQLTLALSMAFSFSLISFLLLFLKEKILYFIWESSEDAYYYVYDLFVYFLYTIVFALAVYLTLNRLLNNRRRALILSVSVPLFFYFDFFYWYLSVVVREERPILDFLVTPLANTFYFIYNIRFLFVLVLLYFLNEYFFRKNKKIFYLIMIIQMILIVVLVAWMLYGISQLRSF